MAAARLLALLRQRERDHGPLIVLNGESLPETPPEVIERASDAGRLILFVRFGRPFDGTPSGHQLETDASV